MSKYLGWQSIATVVLILVVWGAACTWLILAMQGEFEKGGACVAVYDWVELVGQPRHWRAHA